MAKTQQDRTLTARRALCPRTRQGATQECSPRSGTTGSFVHRTRPRGARDDGRPTCRVHFDAQWVSELPTDVDFRPGDVLEFDDIGELEVGHTDTQIAGIDLVVRLRYVGFRAERKAAFAEDEKRARKAGSPVTGEKFAELRRKMEEEEEEPRA